MAPGKEGRGGLCGAQLMSEGFVSYTQLPLTHFPGLSFPQLYNEDLELKALASPVSCSQKIALLKNPF